MRHFEMFQEDSPARTCAPPTLSTHARMLRGIFQESGTCELSSRTILN